MGISASGKYHHGGAVFVAPLRLEDGQRGRIFARLALGLRSIARPQADGLNAQEVIVFADRRAGLLLRPGRRTGQQTHSQSRKEVRKEVLHFEPPRHSGGLYSRHETLKFLYPYSLFPSPCLVYSHISVCPGQEFAACAVSASASSKP